MKKNQDQHIAGGELKVLKSIKLEGHQLRCRYAPSMNHKTTFLLTRELEGEGQYYELKLNGKTIEGNKVKGKDALDAYVEKIR